MKRMHVNLKKIAAMGIAVLAMLAVSVLTSCGSAEITQSVDMKTALMVSEETYETEEDTPQTSTEEDAPQTSTEEDTPQTSTEETEGPSEQDILVRSKEQYHADFEALKAFDLDEAEQLAIILAVRYVDMQQRIDLEALGNLSPQIKAGMENQEEAFIRQFLTMDDYELYAVDSAVLQDKQLSFNAAYSFTINDPDIGKGQSMLYTKFLYQWTDEGWVLTETGEDARPDLSGKPNRSLVLWGMQDKTKEVFGVEDMTELFDDFGASYRMEYEERYGAEQ